MSLGTTVERVHRRSSAGPSSHAESADGEKTSEESGSPMSPKKTLVSRLALPTLGLLACACSSDAWPCEDGDGVTYDIAVVQFPTDFDAPLRPIGGAEICLIDPPCPCREADADGRLSVRLPREQRLLFDARASTYLTTVSSHVTGNVDRAAQVVLIDRNTATVLAATVGARLDRTRGHLGIRTAPAASGDVSGTTYTLRNRDTGETFPLTYTVEGLPMPDATSSDDTGAAIGLNLPVGDYRVESPTFATCATVDAGWPVFEEGRLVALDFPIEADSLTVIDVLQCLGAR